MQQPIMILRRWGLCVAIAFMASPLRAAEPEILVVGSPQQTIKIFSESDYWGEIPQAAVLFVPPFLSVAVLDTWDKEAAALPVNIKKELFYRSLLPLVLYSNQVISGDRARLEAMASDQEKIDKTWLEGLARNYRLLDPEKGESLPEGGALTPLIAELLNRVDTVPPSLALGQAAYESGYATSRFAREGNALFGQWIYGGTGMQPKEKRASKGDYAIAAYDWPLDSVRAYMRNLNTHRAYGSLRKTRAAARASGRSPSGLELAETLTTYSEKGSAYVATLIGIMRVNELVIADKARLRDEPVVLIVDVEKEDDIAAMEAEIAALRSSGELTEILKGMGVDF